MIPRFNVRYNFKDLLIALFGSGYQLSQNRNNLQLPGFDSNGLHIIPTHRGREALYLILKALGLPNKARVGVPFYACSVVSKTVVAAGMVPVFVDADPVTFGLNLSDLRKKADNLDCLILVHMFGYPADFDNISQLMQGRTIIEDCAHALGSFYKRRPLGSLAEVSFFSFGFFKPFSVGGGGCIVTHSTTLFEKLKAMLDKTPEETFQQAIIHTIQCLFYSLAWHKIPYTFLVYLRSHTSGSKGDIEETEDIRCVIISDLLKMRRSDFNVLLFRLRSWLLDSEIKPDFWLQLRDIIPDEWYIPPEPTFGRWNHFILPVRAPTLTACDNAIARLMSMGVGAARLYPNRAVKLMAIGYGGDCPEAEQLSQSIFMLPSHTGLSSTDRKRIILSIKRALIP